MKHPTQTNAHRRGFTIVEIMVVVIIIGVLAALIVPTILGRTGKARTAVAASKLAAIENAVNLFASEYERLPNALDELVSRPEDIDEATWSPPTLKPGDLNDPWGKPYVYRYPGENWTFDLFSLGRDGQEGGEGEDADVVNWK